MMPRNSLINRSSLVFMAGIILTFMLVIQDGNIEDSSDLTKLVDIHNITAVNNKTLEFVPSVYSDSTAWVMPIVPDVLRNATHDDPDLIKHIRDHWLLAPSSEQLKLSRTDIEDYSQLGQSRVIDRLLNNKTGGFFIESGAGNGERLSNSLFFEKHRNWTGLLIEPNPDNFKTLQGKARHSYVINACLSPEPEPLTLTLRKATLASALEEFTDVEHTEEELKRKGKYKGVVKVQCFPLHSILKALNVTHIDYFSLDVEGPEIEILRTISFDDLDISTLSVEYDVTIDKEKTKIKRDRILKLMTSRGYKLAEDVEHQDLVFIQK